MTVMGANPGGPAFLVADSITGRVMYTKRATGTGSEAINKCADAAKRLARRNGRSYIIFLDMSRAQIGGSISVPRARALGITEEIHPDGSVTRGNPPRRRKSGDSEIDSMIGSAWARFMSGVQVSVMEIPKIFRDIKLEMSGGMTLEDAVRTVGTRYRVNRNPGIGEAILGGMAGALASRAFQSNPHLEGEPCSFCGGDLAYLGTLGTLEHYRCRNCGMEFNTPVQRLKARRKRIFRRRCSHNRLAATCGLCRSDRRGPGSCHHGYVRGRTGGPGGTVCRACEREQRPGSPIQNNPAISRSWNGLKLRPRLAILEFAGVPYEQARRLAGRAWETLPPSIQGEVSKGWQENSSKSHAAVKANPGPRGKRRMTMTVERFANWVKSKRDPAMWKAFLAKFKGYESWTHGSRARKVTVEWVDTPGVDGLWITYDGGKQPESTYIMPKGSKRKGAWKHPWDTMPDIKHDPQAGIVITKLRGQSKITDFYHK
jgi:hypothetical protein